MGLKRRQILQYSGAGGLLAVLQPLQAKPPAQEAVRGLRTTVMPDDSALPKFAAGQLLVADTSQISFDEDAIYFYPAWGTPRPWRVSLGSNDMLVFRNPGSGRVAWTQSRFMNPQFAGKLAAKFLPAVLANLPPLWVPTLPA